MGLSTSLREKIQLSCICRVFTNRMGMPHGMIIRIRMIIPYESCPIIRSIRLPYGNPYGGHARWDSTTLDISLLGSMQAA